MRVSPEIKHYHISAATLSTFEKSEIVIKEKQKKCPRNVCKTLLFIIFYLLNYYLVISKSRSKVKVIYLGDYRIIIFFICNSKFSFGEVYIVTYIVGNLVFMATSQ